MNKKTLALLGYMAAAILVVIGVMYLTQPANHLPQAFPGYSATETKIHFKHGVAAVLLALGAIALAWFQGGKPSSEA